LVARLFQAVVSGGQGVAVEDLDHVAFEQGGRLAPKAGADDVSDPRGGVADEFGGGDGGLDALEFGCCPRR
jgi:hypothetical protein